MKTNSSNKSNRVSCFSRIGILLLVWLIAAAAFPARAAGLQTLQGHVPAAVAALQPLRPVDGTNQLHLSVGLPVRDQQGLSSLLEQLYDPKSTNYHQFLTVAQFAERFGSTTADYQKVQAFAAANHLIVEGTYPNRLVVDVKGSVAEINTALHITMQVYQHPTEAREFFAPGTEPSLNLDTDVDHISGLDNFQLPKPMLIKRSSPTAVAKPSGELGSGPGGTYIGYDFRSAYLPGVTLTGTGQTVGLLEISSGFFQSDLTTYETLAGLPNVPVSAVLLNGYNGSEGSGADEVSLDIEMAISFAPGLTAVDVFEGSSVSTILSSMASSNTIKQFGSSWTYSANSTVTNLFHELGAQGQSFFNASGDSDAYTGRVSAPADDPYITVVGGTTLSTTVPGGSWISEKVWNWGGGEGGSGGSSSGSSSIAIPSWQAPVSMASNQGSTTKRNLPDVALTADNVFVTYSNGLSGLFGGTSCATPLWAAFVSLINQQAAANGNATLGFINPAVYAIGLSGNYTNCFHDTILGNNTWASSPTKYYAVPGYDLCTGWGTPTGQPLIDALSPDSLGLAPASGLSASGVAGGPFANSTVTLKLTNNSASTMTWTSGNPVSWMSAAPTTGTLTPGQVGSVTLTLNAAAASLADGVYRGSIWFTNGLDGIAQVLQNVLVVIPPPDLNTYESTLLSYKPLGYWQLNESTVPPSANTLANAGSLGVSETGFGYNGVGLGQTGIVGTCASFSNPTLIVAYLGTYIDVPHSPVIDTNGAFTVEFWANPNQSPNDFFCPVSSLDDTENSAAAREGWVFYEASGNTWTFRMGNASGYVAELTGGTVTPSAWQHVAAVYTGSTVTMYVNGVAVAGPTAVSGYLPNTNITVPMRIGATSFGNRTFDGLVDEVAVYTTALGASDISAHYNAATTNNTGYDAQILADAPVGYWHLDEPAYTPPVTGSLPTAYNIGSLSYLAEGTYEAGSVPGVPGVPAAGLGSGNLACLFQASSDIDVPGAYLGLTGATTISAWVKIPPGNSALQSVVSMGAGSYELNITAQNEPQFVDGIQSFGAVTATNVINDNQWHQLAGVYDGVHSEYLYLDGQLAAQSTAATAVPLANGNDLLIGNEGDAGVYQYLNGTVDEVAIFASALSLNQLQWLYATGSDATLLNAVPNSPAAGQVSLNWVTIPGETYLLQYSTNLSQTNWITLDGPVTVTTPSLSFTDTFSASPQRFYRAVLVP